MRQNHEAYKRDEGEWLLAAGRHICRWTITAIVWVLVVPGFVPGEIAHAQSSADDAVDGRLGGTLQSFGERFGDPVGANEAAGTVFNADGYGPIFVSLIIAFLTAAAVGLRWRTYPLPVLGWVAVVWLVPLIRGEDPPPTVVSTGIAAWLLVLLAAAEGIRQRRAVRDARRQRKGRDGPRGAARTGPAGHSGAAVHRPRAARRARAQPVDDQRAILGGA